MHFKEETFGNYYRAGSEMFGVSLMGLRRKALWMGSLVARVSRAEGARTASSTAAEGSPVLAREERGRSGFRKSYVVGVGMTKVGKLTIVSDVKLVNLKLYSANRW